MWNVILSHFIGDSAVFSFLDVKIQNLNVFLFFFVFLCIDVSKTNVETLIVTLLLLNTVPGYLGVPIGKGGPGICWIHISGHDP